MTRSARFESLRSTPFGSDTRTGRPRRRGIVLRRWGRFWLVLLLAAAAGSPAGALPFLAADEIYSEDFEAETGFPTSPEIDSLSIGGLEVYLGPIGNQPPDPTVSGGRVHLQTAPFPDSLQTPYSANGVRFGASGTSPALGVRIEAGAHSLSSVDTEWFGFEAEFFQSTASVSFVSGGISFEDSGGGPVLSLVSQQTTFIFPGGGATTTNESVPLSPALSNAVLSGAFYELDVFIDSDDSVLVTSLEMDGVGSAETPSLSLSGLAAGGVPLVGNVSIRQSIPAIPRTHTAEIESVQLYSDVPEPAFAASLLLGTAALFWRHGVWKREVQGRGPARGRHPSSR